MSFVDMIKRHCFPVYWNGENRRVLRGHWFARKGGLDWLPIREDVAEQLEIAYRSQVWHRRTFQPSGLFAARVDLQGSTPGLHALFTGEDDTWDAWLSVDASGFSSIVSFSRNAIKLRRGYSSADSSKPTQDELRQQKEEEMDDYCSQVPVRHLVFMVHGIGQRLEKSNLVDDVANFRHITARLAEQHLTHHQRGTQRVLFIPCQWRKGLKLSGETAVEKITLDGVRGLRVSNQLNRLYLKFLKRNPGYDGKVSLYGHSLGSVLSYDILCHQNNLSCPFPMDWMFKEHAKNVESLPDEQDSHFPHSSINKDDTLSTLNPSNEKNSMQQIISEVEAENSEESLVSGPASSSEHITAETDAPKPSNEGDVSELLSYSSDMPSETFNELDKSEITNVGPSAKRLSKEECQGTENKDEVIKKLMEEIESLRAHLGKTESRGEGHIEELHPVKQSPEGLSPPQDEPSYTPYIKYTKLQFKVDTFFAVGSPLGVFLSLRNIRLGNGKGQEYWEQENISEEMPACRQMFNIFHPYDPVAYRIEPLVCKEYVGKRPVLIPYHKGGRRLHIGFQEFTEDLAVRTQAVKNYLNSATVKVLTVCQSTNIDNQEDEDSEVEEEPSYGSLMMERLTGSKDGRIDHMLQDKTFEHPYLQAIGSHTNYWRDYDTALFILKHLYRDIPEDPNYSDELGTGNSKNESGSTGWFDRRDTVEEEVPLTFSDKAMVRNFSSKARRIIQKRTASSF
ncbi:hypothetical protein PIB30_007222 [Stylosanthes scabra]|uniref:DDHD domain-containing protein n=1 Tax=Stylosanthes scabra TaxID=79078 RepID=A0ABU6V4T0_9FABA|nr:hypothetical protein [Stylosanthes scabra]